MLDLKEMDPDLRKRVVDAMRSVIDLTELGENPGWRKEVPSGRSMYLDALSELSALIDGSSCAD